jgi:hypothetical protein
MNHLSRESRARCLASSMAIAAASLVVGACERTDATVVARAPVLQGCLSAVQKRVEDAPQFQHSVRYVAFDDSLREVPHVVGFVELASSVLSQEELNQYAGGFTTDCRTRYRDVYDLNEAGSVDRLAQFLGHAQERRVSFRDLDGTGGPVDPDQMYMTFGNGQVQLFFNIESP